jgi:hypothetical protein
LPAGQLKQDVELRKLDSPLAQFPHVVRPESELNLPAAQPMHSTLPVELLYFPAIQLWQAV